MVIPNVSLTYFVDFVRKSGTPKLTVVHHFKYRDEYAPKIDFYRGLREKVVETLSTGKPITSLTAWAGGVAEKKRECYRQAIQGIRKVVGRKGLSWFDPPRENYTLGLITLNVNPELGLELDGHRNLVKLYLKDARLEKNRAELIIYLMGQALARHSNGAMLGVLDARAGRLHSTPPKSKHLDALLRAEAISFASMYESI